MITHSWRVLLLISIVAYAIVSCEKPEEEDTHAPLVTITSPTNLSVVSEILNVSCTATDEAGIERVELWVNGASTQLTDETEPYSIQLNTLSYNEGESYVLRMLAHDMNGNSAFSDSITVVIDQTTSRPGAINILEIIYDTEVMTVSWEESTDADFEKYELYHSLNAITFDLISEISDSKIISYSLSEFNPLVENYFKLVVYDTLGLFSTGNILASQIHDAPNSVNVTGVMYDLSEMTISWGAYITNLERMNRMLSKHGQTPNLLSNTDFLSYELLYSESSVAEPTSLAIITDIDSTSYTLTDFDPTHENWFWVKVKDYWGLTSTGNPASNLIDDPPASIDVASVTYSLSEMTIIWSQSEDTDFQSYEILYSETEVGEQTSLVTITNVETTSHSLAEFDPTHENWFWVKTKDHWGLTSIGNPASNLIDEAPAFVDVVSVAYTLTEMTITWAQSEDVDFQSYTILYSETEAGEQTSLATITNVETTSHTLAEFDPTHENWFWMKVTDSWGLSSAGNGMTHLVDQPPSAVTLYPIERGSETTTISWSESTEADFHSYTLWESVLGNMSSKTIVDTWTDQQHRSTTISIQEGELKYYQLEVRDVWELSSHSNIEASLIFESLNLQAVMSVATAVGANSEMVRMVPGSNDQAVFMSRDIDRLTVIDYTSTSFAFSQVFDLDLGSETAEISSIDVSPVIGGENYIAVAVAEHDFDCSRGFIMLVRLSDGEVISTVTDIGYNPDGCAFTKDGIYLIVACEDDREARPCKPAARWGGSVAIIDLQNGIASATLLQDYSVDFEENSEPEHCETSVDGTTIVSVQESSAVLIFNANDAPLEMVDVTTIMLPDDGADIPAEPDGLYISPDGYSALISNEYNGTFLMLDVASGLLLNTPYTIEDDLPDGWQRDLRRSTKRTEPEECVLIEQNNRLYALIALQESHAVVVYDVTDPANPVFDSIAPAGIAWQADNDMEKSDIGSEGLSFHPTNGIGFSANEREGSITMFSAEWARN